MITSLTHPLDLVFQLKGKSFKVISIGDPFSTTNSLGSLKIYCSIRTMMSARSIHMARAVYSSLNVLGNSDTLDRLTRTNHTPLTNAIVSHALDHRLGAIQHKTSFLRHIITHRFPSQALYGPFIKETGLDGKVTYQPDVPVDLRVLNELVVSNEYIKRFGSQIYSLHATLDTCPQSFSYQLQSNPDFLVRVRTVDGSSKLVPHDEKSGLEMFKHSTRGSLGLLYYDSNTGENIQVMSSTIGREYLLKHDKLHLRSVKDSVNHDKSAYHFSDEFKKARDILKSDRYKSFTEQHNAYQNYLFSNVHADPRYQRSVSFVFTVYADYSDASEQEILFRNRLEHFLQKDKVYNLDNSSDCKEFCLASLMAYRDTVDPSIFSKLGHLHNGVGIKFNSTMAMDLFKFLRDTMC